MAVVTFVDIHSFHRRVDQFGREVATKKRTMEERTWGTMRMVTS